MWGKIQKYRNYKGYADSILLIICTAVVFLMGIYGIEMARNIHVIGDELGYWGIAAYWSGNDWSSLTNRMNNYYAFGYSFLLTPLFWIFEEAGTMYQAAIVMNAIMIAACLPISVSVARRLFPQVSMIVLLGASFVTCTSTAYLSQSYTAHPECLLILLFWFIVYSVCSIIEKPSSLKMFFVAVITGYGYMTHMRMIGIVIALILVMLLMKWNKAISFKQLAIFLISITSMLVTTALLKEYITLNIYGGVVTKNTYSSSLTKVTNINSFEEIQNFIGALCGQLFYQGAETQLIVFIGIFLLFWCLLLYIKRLLQGGNTTNQDGYSYLKIFLLLSFCAALAISVISLKSGGRIDHTIYGRYIDNITGPIFLIGIITLVSCKWQKKYTGYSMLAIIVFVIMALIANQRINWDRFYNQLNAPWVVNYLEDTSLTQTTIVVILAIGAILICKFLACKFSGHWSLLIFPICFLINLYPTSTVASNILETEMSWYEQGSVIREVLEDNTTSKTVSFWSYTVNTENVAEDIEFDYPNIGRLQFQLYDYTIEPEYNIQEVLDYEEGRYFLTFDDAKEVDLLYDVAMPVVGGENWVLWEIMSQEIQEQKSSYSVLDAYTNPFMMNISSDGWMLGDTAYLNFNITDLKEEYYVVIQMNNRIPFDMLEGVLEEIVVMVYINEQEVQSEILDKYYESDAIRMLISPDILEIGFNQMRIEVSNTWSPSAYGTGDNREFGISVQEINILSIDTFPNVLDFTVGGNSEISIVSGWNTQEESGRWTSEEASIIILSEKKELQMHITSQSYGLSGETEILFNGYKIASIQNEELLTDTIILPEEYFVEGEIQEITFKTANAVSPSEVSESTDERVLGVFITEIELLTIKDTLMNRTDVFQIQ